MFKRIVILEEERVPARGAREWKIEGQKRREESKILREEFAVVGFMAQRGLKYCQEEAVGGLRSSTRRRWQSTAGMWSSA